MKRHTYIRLMIAILLMTGISFSAISIFLPPEGEIHPTVILAMGIIFIMAAILLAIETEYRFKFQWGKDKYIDWQPAESKD